MGLDNFFESIDSVLQTDKFDDCTYPVFRGHARSSYELLPTLLRDYDKTGKDVWTLENNLYCDFRSLVGPRTDFKNSWQTVFAMRHEGIPTRLLDWTENIGTALYFALDAPETDMPHIWILNPFRLNKNSRQDSSLLNPEEDLEQYATTYAQGCFNDRATLTELPFAVYPNRSNDRIFAQRGLFTIHGTNAAKMELTCADYLEQIIIPDDIVDKLKKLLKQFGINKYSVYPDFQGLSGYLKDYYKY